MRKFAVFVATTFLLFLLFMTITTSVAVMTFTPTHLKQWLRTSNVYDSIVDTLTKQAKTAADQSTGNRSSDNSAYIQAAIKKAATPAFLQTTTEQLIDGTTPWLEGKTPKPTFAIDISSVKQTFLQSLADQARARYASLPACAKGQVPDTSDIFAIACQVPGVSIDPQLQQALNDFNSKNAFLPNATISPDTLTTEKDGTKQPVFDQLHDVPKYYRWAHIAPFILGGLAVLAMVTIIFASTERRKGIRRVAITLSFTGVVLLVSLWLTSQGVREAQKQIAKSASDNSVVQNTAIALIKAIQHDANRNLLIFAVVSLVIAGGLFVYLILSKPKGASKPSSGDSESHDKAKPIPEKPKEEKPTPKPPRLVQITV